MSGQGALRHLSARFLAWFSRLSGTPGTLRPWGVILLILQAIFVLLPAVITGHLVDENRTNTLFMDDWTYVPLYEKATTGQLTLHDFFGGYLEHRPAVPRAIYTTLMLASHGDAGLQCIAAFVLVTITWLNCGWLLRRALGGWSHCWLPWGIMGWVLYSPVQWQTLLWPCMMLIHLPLMFFTSALVVLGTERMNLWARLAGCALLAWLASYSYAAGLILWVMIPLAAACGQGLKDRQDRKRFLLAWLVPAGVVLFCYFHGLKNEAESAFAYGQGTEETAGHSVAAVLRAPDKGLRFALTLVGANFARGVLGPRGDLAFYMGCVVAAMFLLAAWAVLREWRRRTCSRAALPFLMMSVFGLVVACMVAAGRAWASKDVGGALNNRFACYSCALAAGVVGLFAILRKPEPPPESGETLPPSLPLTWISWLARPGAGLLCGLLVANWFYGAEMMRCWHYARLRSAVDLHFSPLLGLAQDRDKPAVQIRLSASRAAMLNRLGLMHPPQATTLDLRQFTRRSNLDEKLGMVTGTERRPGTIDVSGYAMLTMRGRPVDAVLLTCCNAASPERRIMDVALPDNLHAFFLLATMKDNQFLVINEHRPTRCGQWTATIKRDQLPKGGNVRVEAWALNFEKREVSLINAGFTVDN